jgi:NAD(P)-dependent dehydrogenase (short-subunit alcohol dehydrogenase family)
MTVAIVTGAGGAVGRATAALLAQRGVTVCACDADGARAAAAVEGAGPRAIGAACDVADPAAVEALFAHAAAELGPVDVLVNATAIRAPAGPAELDDAAWRALLAANLGGTWNTCRAFVAGARAAGRGGAIVNLALAGCATGGGVVGLTRALGLDHAREGIRVNCVAARADEDPGAVARAIAHLASDAASFSVGSALVLGDAGPVP